MRESARWLSAHPTPPRTWNSRQEKGSPWWWLRPAGGGAQEPPGGVTGERAALSAPSKSAGPAGHMGWRLQWPPPLAYHGIWKYVILGVAVSHSWAGRFWGSWYLTRDLFQTIKIFEKEIKLSPLWVIHSNSVARLNERYRRARKQTSRCFLGIIHLFWFSSTNQQEAVVIHIFTVNEVAAQRLQLSHLKLHS